MVIHLKIKKSTSSPLPFYGITQDPETNEYIMVLEYMDDGNLRDHLKNKFNKIDWKFKLDYLVICANFFKNIHKLDIIHHDFHPGNVYLGALKILVQYLSQILV
jgi:serine/threonine protein kinase